MRTYFLYREGGRRTDVLDANSMPEAIDQARQAADARERAEVFKVAYDPAALDNPTILDIRPVAG